jgi:hypothetical protein
MRLTGLIAKHPRANREVVRFREDMQPRRGVKDAAVSLRDEILPQGIARRVNHVNHGRTWRSFEGIRHL